MGERGRVGLKAVHSDCVITGQRGCGGECLEPSKVGPEIQETMAAPKGSFRHWSSGKLLDRS
jgi:hypothetical protein